MKQLPAQRGLTLVELMVTIAILAIVTSIALPSLQSWQTIARSRAHSNDLVTSLQLAKSNAIQRGIRVSLCRSANPMAASPACTATAGTWATGWIVFVDNTQVSGNVAGTIDGTDTVIRVNAGLTGSTVAAPAGMANWVSFLPSGLSRGNGGLPNGTLTLCTGNTNPRGVNVVINSVGRIERAATTC